MVSAKSSGNSNAGTTTVRAERSPAGRPSQQAHERQRQGDDQQPEPWPQQLANSGRSQPWSVAVVLVHEIGEVPGRVQDLEAGGVDSRLALPVGQVAKYVRRVRQPRHPRRQRRASR